MFGIEDFRRLGEMRSQPWAEGQAGMEMTAFHMGRTSASGREENGSMELW